jgi:hypothetical protein
MARQQVPDEMRVEEYLDAAGKSRRFRLQIYAGGRFLEAREIRDDAPSGLRFVLAVPAGEPPPWGELRRRMRASLAKRYVVRDLAGTLVMLHDRIRGQLDEDDDRPALLVDDLRLTWDELGDVLLPMVGFNICIEITDPTGE